MVSQQVPERRRMCFQDGRAAAGMPLTFCTQVPAFVTADGQPLQGSAAIAEFGWSRAREREKISRVYPTLTHFLLLLRSKSGAVEAHAV